MTTVQADKMKPARGNGGLREKDTTSHRSDYSKRRIAAPLLFEPTLDERRDHLLSELRVHRARAALFINEVDYYAVGIKSGLLPVGEGEAWLDEVFGRTDNSDAEAPDAS
ncbi:hypothetical protein FHS85_004793 [Rhodoligotrophos appendicifer]|uniref:hypothetical protein n=1 Tax=Rhodoligotrophos appendicifer TaxID=987056 RepID=UPI001478CD1E|nr:hypothetical protein [Rhodoligotrophos appendicifer]